MLAIVKMTGKTRGVEVDCLGINREGEEGMAGLVVVKDLYENVD